MDTYLYRRLIYRPVIVVTAFPVVAELCVCRVMHLRSYYRPGPLTDTCRFHVCTYICLTHALHTPPTHPSGPLAVRIRHACDVYQTYGRVCPPVDAAIVACVLWTPFFCLCARSTALAAGHVSVGGYPEEIVSISEPCCSTS